MHPLESQRRFAPRFCPHADCPLHRGALSRGSRFSPCGGYFRKDRRRVQRFRCPVCRRTFSKSTFSTAYYLKRPELSVPIACALAAGSAHRQTARSLGCAPSTVTRRSARLGRHALLLLALALDSLPPLDEPVVLDHFETFEFTQDLPFGVATPIGHRSRFVYALDPAPHRRTGSRSPAQRLRLARRPRRSTLGGYRASLRRTLEILLTLLPEGRRLLLVSDGHPAYRDVVGRPPFQGLVDHACHPNPPRGPKGSPRSPQAIARDRAMGPSDHYHRFLRHSLAHHRRETIAFGRRVNALMERLFLAVAWTNFIRGVSERRPRSPSPAMRLGLTDARWTWPRLLARRLFPARLSVPAVWMEIYRRTWVTPVLPSNTRHALVHAF